jgi:hypothetical protein
MKILLRDFNKGKQREQIFSNKNQEWEFTWNY